MCIAGQAFGFVLQNVEPAPHVVVSLRIDLQIRLTDLGMARLHVDGSPMQNRGSCTLKLRLPRRDLIGVNVELFSRLSQRSVALAQPPLSLRQVFCTGAVVCSSFVRSDAKFHLSSCADSRDRLSVQAKGTNFGQFSRRSSERIDHRKRAILDNKACQAAGRKGTGINVDTVWLHLYLAGGCMAVNDNLAEILV